MHTIRGMNWNLSSETRCKYVHVRSDAASMRHTVSGNRSHFMPLTVNETAVVLNIQYFIGYFERKRITYTVFSRDAVISRMQDAQEREFKIFEKVL